MCSVFWLFWLRYQYLPSDWLRKPNHGEGIISRKPRPKSAHDFLGLLYCFIVLLCICVVSCPYVIYYPTVMMRCSLFVLKVPLNPKQAKQTNYTIIGPVLSSWGGGVRSANCLLTTCLLNVSGASVLSCLGPKLHNRCHQHQTTDVNAFQMTLHCRIRSSIRRGLRFWRTAGRHTAWSLSSTGYSVGLEQTGELVMSITTSRFQLTSITTAHTHARMHALL